MITKFRPILSLLGMVFILSIVTIGIIKIWNPELIANEVFEKMILTFALLALGSVSILFLSSFKGPDKDTDDKKPH